jgi:hypothetical protein
MSSVNHPLAGYRVLVKILCYDIDMIVIMIRDLISLVGENTNYCYFQLFELFPYYTYEKVKNSLKNKLRESIPNFKSECIEILQNEPSHNDLLAYSLLNNSNYEITILADLALKGYQKKYFDPSIISNIINRIGSVKNVKQVFQLDNNICDDWLVIC